MSASYILVGAADPGGRALGFLLPVFRLHPSNSLFVQRASHDDRIDGFEPARLHGLQLLEVADDVARVGEPARWAFALGADDVIQGEGSRGRGALEKRLGNPPLRDMPALAFEVAEFLGLRARRARLAARTFKRIARTSEAAANHWRDLSVLTPDVRAAFAARLGTDLAKGVVATSGAGVIRIGRPGPAGDPVDADMLEAVNDVLEELRPLYGTGWKVAFAETRELAQHLDRPDALVYVPDRRLDELLQRIAETSALRLECYPERSAAEFGLAVRRLGRPGFIVGEAEDDERLQAAAADLGTGLVALSMTPPASVSRPLVHGPSSMPTVLMAAPSGRPGAPGRLPSRAGSVVQAMAAALVIADTIGGTERLPPRSVLLRARGLGPDPDTDAWLAVQDRAWALGLDGYEALRVGPTIRRIEDRGFGPDWAASGFYRHSEPFAGISNRAFAAMRSEAVALVPTVEPGADADARRMLAILQLLERQGWNVAPSQSEQADGSGVSGARWTFEVDPRRREIPSRWRIEPLLDSPLRDVGVLVPSPEAGAGAILARLFGYGELTVSVRDLVRLPAERATVYTLLGAQLRRLAAAMPSRARSHFVALLVNEALTSGSVQDASGDELHEIVRHSQLGTRLILGLRQTATSAEGVQTHVHPALRDDVRRPWEANRPARPFRLTVHDGGVAVTGLEQP